LAPRQYVRTTIQTVLAGVAGSFTDRRETLAALDPRPTIAPDLDCSGEEELWVDYLADTGDGFAHTFPVAWAVAQDQLEVDGHPEPLPAGRVLVLGGDQVYPVASDDAYRDRLVGVFRAALPWREQGATRDAVAIPGNHDWYDGLGAFSRAFCQQRWIGAWRTHQHRSYFAVRLPHDWWWWGVDIALAGLVDRPQLDYFEAMAERAARVAQVAGTTPRLVIATAKPTWLDATPSAPTAARLDRSLDHLVERIAGGHGIEVAAIVSGDKHYYARFEPGAGDVPSRIVSGGGGAFLHPTDHVPDRLSVAHDEAARPDDELVLAARAPTPSESRRLRLRAVWCGFRNGAFPVVTALAYLAWLVPAPARIAVAAAALASTIALARRPSLRDALPWAAPHAAAHVGCMALALAAADAATDGTSLWWRAAALLVAGGLVAPVIVGLYFVVAGTIAGINDNEAFAGIRARRYEHFLRFHVDRDGAMHLYVIGIDDPPPRRAWRLSSEGAPSDPWFATIPELRLRLLDGPIELGSGVTPVTRDD
jgi:hypothetical protein